MARLVVYGAEAQSFAESSTLTSNPSGVSFDTSVKRSGAASLKCSKTGTGAAAHTLTGWGSSGSTANYSAATAYGSPWLRFDENPSSDVVIAQWLNTSSAVKASLTLTSTGTLVLKDAAGSTLATSSAIGTGSFHCVQSKLGTSASAAAWEFLVDGVSVGSGSSANTTATNHGFLKLGYTGSENVTHSLYWDDVIVDSAAYAPYGSQVGLLLPDGNSGTNTGYTASTGAKNACVDDAPGSEPDTAYLYATTLVTYTATMQACTSSGWATGSVIGSVVPMMGHSVYSGGGSQKLTIRSGASPGNTSYGTGVSDPSTMAFLGRILETEPIGGTAWTESLVNGLEVGGTLTSIGPGGGVRMDVCYAMVEYQSPAAYSYTGSGGATAGGSGTYSYSPEIMAYTYLGAGSLIANGAGALAIQRAYVGSGGLILQGSATQATFHTYDYTGSGTVKAGGLGLYFRAGWPPYSGLIVSLAHYRGGLEPRAHYSGPTTSKAHTGGEVDTVGAYSGLVVTRILYSGQVSR